MEIRQLKLIEDLNESLVVVLEGDSFIDANLLAETIKDFVSLVEYSRREISPSTNMELKVEAFQPGSFRINFQAIFDVLSSNEAGNISGVFGFIVSAVPKLISFVKFLMGKKPEKIERNHENKTIVVTNFEGTQVTINQPIYNIYADPGCNTAVANMFERLEMDGTRDNIQIITKDAKETVGSECFKHLAKPTTLEEMNDNVTVQRLSNVEVLVRKPDLTGYAQWMLYFTKNINMTIEDSSFIEQVHDGVYQFGAYDRLVVDLRIETTLDDRGLDIAGSERYFVEVVHRYVSFKDRVAENQISFDDM